MVNSVNLGLSQQKWLRGILFGQITAILGAIGGSATEGLGKENLPMTQTACQYILLLFVNGALMLGHRKPLVNKWYTYLGIAGLDAVATYSTYAALSYTSVTSWSFLTPSGVLVCIPLSYWILKARYNVYHYVGIVVALVGMAMLILYDHQDKVGGSNPLLGDFLVLLGSAVYSLNSIWMEKILKADVPTRELLSMLGGFGIVYAVIGVWLLREHERSWASTTKMGLLRLVTVLCVFCFYCLYPFVLAWSGSTVMQLSLLGTAIWSVPSRVIFFEGFGGHWWAFGVAAVMSLGGMVIFTWAGNVYGRAVNYEVLDDMCSEEDPMRADSLPNMGAELQMTTNIQRRE